MTHLLLALTRLVALLPLPWLRSIGWLLGRILHVLVRSRRRVVMTNLRLCFPAWTEQKIHKCSVDVFVHFVQSWLDRGWLWHASPALTRERLHLVGAVHELAGNDPLVIFAPHFMGLDAGWTALTQQIPRRFSTIYTNQANLVSDAWILQGRKRFGEVCLFGRSDGVKAILTGLKKGDPLYLLPDMNFGPEDSVFVPFYGVQAATVPSLSRFAKLARAKVVPITSRMTKWGYDIEVHASWTDFPSNDIVADTAQMNARLQTYIDSMPSQYYWVHKRFKDRPAGEFPPY